MIKVAARGAHNLDVSVDDAEAMQTLQTASHFQQLVS